MKICTLHTKQGPKCCPGVFIYIYIYKLDYVVLFHQMGKNKIIECQDHIMEIGKLYIDIFNIKSIGLNRDDMDNFYNS